MSEPMKWAELRERVAALFAALSKGGDCNATCAARELLADTDAAAPAMERQERIAKAARSYAAHRGYPCCEFMLSGLNVILSDILSQERDEARRAVAAQMEATDANH